jgi:hypothetical protein
MPDREATRSQRTDEVKRPIPVSSWDGRFRVRGPDASVAQSLGEVGEGTLKAHPGSGDSWLSPIPMADSRERRTFCEQAHSAPC